LTCRLPGHNPHAALSTCSIWLTWWLGDVGGQLLVTPFIVLSFKSNFREVDRVELQRLAVLLAATIIVGIIAYEALLDRTTVAHVRRLLRRGGRIAINISYEVINDCRTRSCR
jgi:hypothetical protein